MLIVSGHIRVDPSQRAAFVAESAVAVRMAREAEGCLDFAVSVDAVDDGRVNIYERWTDARTLETFRGSGPPSEMNDVIVSADMARYEISAEGPP